MVLLYVENPTPWRPYHRLLRSNDPRVVRINNIITEANKSHKAMRTFMSTTVCFCCLIPCAGIGLEQTLKSMCSRISNDINLAQIEGVSATLKQVGIWEWNVQVVISIE